MKRQLERVILLYRVDNILKDPLYKMCLERNATWEQNRRFCRHDLQHMLDVARITYILMLEGSCLDKAAVTGISNTSLKSKEIIYAAGLLHDMARWLEYETGEDHAAASARMAGPVLERAGFDPVEQEIITTAIGEHRNAGTEASLLGQYICRADDLARPCNRCAARDECYKIGRMPTAQLFLY